MKKRWSLLLLYYFYCIIHIKMSEVYPVTSCEVSLANVVSDIEFDVEKIADYMRSIGYADEEIATTTITAEDYKRHEKEWGLSRKHDYRALGKALLDTMEVVLLPGAKSSAANLCRERNHYGPVSDILTVEAFDEKMSRLFSQAVSQELWHLITDIREGTRSYDDIIKTIRGVGDEAHAIFDDYENDDHEARSREPGMNAPEDLIRISYKEQLVARKKIKRLRKRNGRVISRM